MKKINIDKQQVKYITTILFVLAISIIPALAQGDGFDDPAPGDVPIDGGLSLLVAAGVGYGIKKVRHRNKK